MQSIKTSCSSQLVRGLFCVLVLACGGERTVGPTPSSAISVLSVGIDSATGAMIETDKDDYAPGEVVQLVGRGWSPNETISLYMTEVPDTHGPFADSVVADASGNFSLPFYHVQLHDLGSTFTLTATGRASGSVATLVFTDGATVLSITSITPAAPAPGAPFTADISVDINGSGGNRIWRSTGWWIDGGTETCADTPDRVNTNGVTNHTLTGFTAPGTLGSHTLTMQAYENAGCSAKTGGEKTFTFTVSASDLTIAKTHSGNFTQGSSGSYSVTVTNAGNLATSGTVSVIDVLPSGLSATAISGTGWSCVLATLTCTRSDALAAGAAYAAITLSANVAPNAPTSVINTATVSGGGEVNTGNNAALDPTTIIVANQAPVVSAGGAKAGSEGSSIALNGSAIDNDGTITSVLWSIAPNDGTCTIAPPTSAVTSVTCEDNGSWTLTLTATDDDGASAQSSATLTVSNVAPAATFNAPSSIDEGTAIGLSLSNVVDPGTADTHTFAFDCGTGSGYGSASTTPNASCPTNDNGIRIVKGKVLDDDGGYSEYSASVTIDNVDPTISGLSLAPASLGNIYPVSQAVTLNVTFTDPGTADTHTCVAVATSFGVPTVTGSIGAGSAGACSSTLNFVSAGVYDVTMTVNDDDAGTDAATVQIIVYDPSAGFVTGGGWINSPAGAYVLDAGLSGKATFGFVSKYKRGATVPEGNTQFVFHAGGFNFHSSTYQWLVVNQNSSNAQFKGTGTVNGAEGYTFMLWATDGSTDRFRIKIWDTATNVVVYDNLVNAVDSAAPQAIAGGSIVIHAK